MTIHAKAPVAAAICVTVRAWAVFRPAPTLLPALKPNHPTHSRPAPIMVMVRLLGFMAVWG
jgi:hypothetical protein